MSFGDPLLSLAMVLVAAILGGELFGFLRLPKVTGWIGTGIVLRALDLPGLEVGTLGRFAPFGDFVLGYIAFTVGATLRVVALRNAGKRLLLLLLSELTVTPLVVFAALHWVGGLEMGTALVLAAIAIAGAPGTTVLVVREARARGILTRTLIAAVGLIDMVAVAVFAFAVTLLGSGGEGSYSWDGALSAVGVEFGVAGAIGLGCGVVTVALTRRVVGPAFVGPWMVAVILGAWGLAKGCGVSSILACTFAGITLANLRHSISRSAQAYLHPFGGVLFAGFYTLAGMRLNFGLVVPLAGLVGVYFLSRVFAKSVGSYLAMRLSGATQRVQRYLGLALIPHGGVAVGLIFFVQEAPALAGMADTVAAVGLSTLALNQLFGPSAARFALTKTGETKKDRPRLLDFIAEQHIVTDLKAKTKREVIEILTDRLYATTTVPVSKEEFISLALQREAEESTCLGQGFMIPHALLESGEETRGVLGLSRKGLDLGAYDGELVHAVVLLATPQSDRQRHLEVLAAFARAITGNENLRVQLYAARTPAHAYEVLHAGDSEDLNYFLDEAKHHAATPDTVNTNAG